jgi:translation initiation factor 1A
LLAEGLRGEELAAAARQRGGVSASALAAAWLAGETAPAAGWWAEASLGAALKAAVASERRGWKRRQAALLTAVELGYKALGIPGAAGFGAALLGLYEAGVVDEPGVTEWRRELASPEALKQAGGFLAWLDEAPEESGESEADSESGSEGDGESKAPLGNHSVKPPSKRRGRHCKAEPAGLSATAVEASVVLKTEGQAYAQVSRALGQGHVELACFDGLPRLGVVHQWRLGGKKARLQAGDLVLVALRPWQDRKADVLRRYSEAEARALQRLGEVPAMAVARSVLGGLDLDDDFGVDWVLDDVLEGI